MLGVIWWMYGGYAWLTNAVAPDGTGRRLLLLGGMAGFLILALVIPRAFTGGGPAFGMAYLVVVGVHAALFTHTSAARRSARRGSRTPRLSPGSGSPTRARMRAPMTRETSPWPLASRRRWHPSSRALLPVATGIVEPLRPFGAYAQALEPQADDDDTARLLRYFGRRPDWAAQAPR